MLCPKADPRAIIATGGTATVREGRVWMTKQAVSEVHKSIPIRPLPMVAARCAACFRAVTAGSGPSGIRDQIYETVY
jgi:hypothetical protein